MSECKDCLYYPICDAPREGEECGHFEKAVIRCKDCKHRYMGCPMTVSYMGYIKFFTEDNDYCSRAERLEE